VGFNMLFLPTAAESSKPTELKLRRISPPRWRRPTRGGRRAMFDAQAECDYL